MSAKRYDQCTLSPLSPSPPRLRSKAMCQLGFITFVGWPISSACLRISDEESIASRPEMDRPTSRGSIPLPEGEPSSRSEAETGGGGQIDIIEDISASEDNGSTGETKPNSTPTASNSGDETSTNGLDATNTSDSENTTDLTSTDSAETGIDTDLGDDSEGTGTNTGTSSGDSSGDTGANDEDITSPISIVVPEVYSSGQRVGYLLEMDDTAVLKIWDDRNSRVFRLNEKTGYLVGTQKYFYFTDSACKIPAHSVSSEGSECYHGSEDAAKPVFIEGGNATGTIQGHSAKTYSAFSKFRPYYTQSSPGSECNLSGKPPNVFSHCLRTIEDIEDVPLSLALPIEVRFPNDPEYDLGNSRKSTLTVYSAGEVLGDFVGFNEEVISVYQPSERRIFGINKSTGNVVGGPGRHTFSDDQCTQNLTRTPSEPKVHLCTPLTQGQVPSRSELWTHKGDGVGWEIGQYTLESTGPLQFINDIYWTPWFLIRCIAGRPHCMQEAARRTEFPLHFSTPIEIRSAAG